MAENNDRRAAYESSPPTSWGSTPHIYPHSYHGTPAQEYSGFNFNSPPLPMERASFVSTIQHRPSHSQLQPLVMPQWPSMLSSQSHSGFPPAYPQAVQQIQPMSLGSLQTPLTATPLTATPISASSARSTSGPRRTLTDADRKKMCLYAEEHPNAKQTEIGSMFGVERSTVSKVLRQKEKYLAHDDGGNSPIKRLKGRSPDVERALAVWTKNQARKGLPLDDEAIREKARYFAATTNSPDSHNNLSDAWVEKFKLNNNLLGARSRKGSLAPDDTEGISSIGSSSHCHSGTSPVSPDGLKSSSPPDLRSAQSQENLKQESPEHSYHSLSSRHGPIHSQSLSSLHSMFTDATAPSSFSPGALSPSTSFFTTPDSGTAPSEFVPPLTARPIFPPPTASNSQRPRSMTFPYMDIAMSGSNDGSTPKYVTSNALDSPMEESSDPLMSINEAVSAAHSGERPHTVSPADTMRPPPLPAHILATEVKREITPTNSLSTSPHEARQALEVVLSFIQQQPPDFLNFDETKHVLQLMDKLKLQSRPGSEFL